MATRNLFSQQRLTNVILVFLQPNLNNNGILIGDGIAPQDGGWTAGQYGRSTFVPYAVLALSSISQSLPRPQIADPFGDAATSWQLRSFGASRSQADYVADWTRYYIDDLELTDLDIGSEQWRVQQVAFPTLQGPNRSDAVDPPHWSITDTVTITLTRTKKPGITPFAVPGADGPITDTINQPGITGG